MQKAKIIVAVRKRPLFQKQKAKGQTDIITVNGINQVLVYDHIIGPLIDSAFQGAKVSCFAYGQTGSGKTHTMNGVMSKNLPGLYTLGATDIFYKLQQEQNRHFKAYLSFYEIYCTKLYDLLNKRSQLILRQDAKSNINVVGLSQIPLTNVEQFQQYLKVGSSQRVTSQNSANSQSSRSHAILQITIKNGKKTHGKVYFIDLAGNQRGADHMNMKKQTQKDGQQINKSLLQLKQCIRGLDQGKNHVPFRGSKLTMCLKDSFIGFCRTVMIGNISPSSASSQNTLNTLRYADRVKQLKNNDDLSKQQLKNRQMMLTRGNKNAIKIAINNSDDQDDIAEKKRKALDNYGVKVQQPTTNIGNGVNAKQQQQQGNRVPSMAKDDSLTRKHSMGVGPKGVQQSVGNTSNKGSSLAKNNLQSSRNISRNTELVRGVGGRNNTHVIKKQQKQVPSNDYNQQQPPKLNLSSHSQMMQSSIQQRMKNQGNMGMEIEQQQPRQSVGNSMDMRKNSMGYGQQQNGQGSYRAGNNNNNNNMGSLTARSNNNNNNTSNGNNTRMLYNNQNHDQQHHHSEYNNTQQQQGGYLAQQYNSNPNVVNGNGNGNNNNNMHLNNNLNRQNSYNNVKVNIQQQHQQQEPISPMPKNPLKTNNFFVGGGNKNSSNNDMHIINNNSQNGSGFNQQNGLIQQQQQNYYPNNNYGNQYQQQQQQPNSMFPEQQQQQSSSTSWNYLINGIQQVATTNPSLREQYHMKLNENLLQEQNHLIGQHSNTLQLQIQKIKQQMSTIKNIEQNRESITSKQYAQIMYDSIDEKMSQLQMLKQSLTTFMYKLDDMEQIQQKLEIIKREQGHHTGGGGGEDEQLLDDFC